jgi:hypothetical protein
MIDRREAILVRLLAIMGSIDDVETVARDRGLLDNDARPALVLLDGDEQERTPRVGRNVTGRQAMIPVMMTMRPQLFVVLKNKKPANEGQGPLLNTLRTAVITAIANDATLLTLVGSNGDIVYNGCETDMKSGSGLDGQARLDFSLTYPLDPYA